MVASLGGGRRVVTASVPFHFFSAPVALLALYPAGRLRVKRSEVLERKERRLRDVPTASSWVKSRWRRALEFGVAAVSLAVLSPVFAACWILVAFTSSGSGIFRQMRAGRYGTTFALYKFRSMRNSSAEGCLAHTVHNDGRITSVGAVLRRYKLDELPQFWNVLKGDMSLVGPRPKLPHHEGLEMPYRPGLTGKATLAFRHEERMLLEVQPDQVEQFYQEVVKPIKAQLDLEYMREATFLSDVRLLWQTMKRCIHCPADPRAELLEMVDRYAPQARHYLTDVETLQQHYAPEKITGSGFGEELAPDLDDAA